MDRDSYEGRYGYLIEPEPDGSRRVERDGQSIIVPVDQKFDIPEIDDARALWEGLEVEREAAESGGRGDPDLLRVRSHYALCRWKILAYEELIRTAPARDRPSLIRKRDYWRSEEVRVRGTDRSGR
jgi:hypothetical protein